MTMGKRRRTSNQLRRALSSLKGDIVDFGKTAASLTPLGPAISLYNGSQKLRRLTKSVKRTGRALRQELKSSIGREKRQYLRRSKVLLRFPRI